MMTTARIPPMEVAELDDDARALVGSVDTSGVEGGGVLRTLVRHRELFRQFVPYASLLLHGNIDPRVRELIALRIADRCDSQYEWAKHQALAIAAGLTDDDFEAIRTSGYSHWTGEMEAVVRAVDELHDNATVTDETWELLSAHYDQQDLIEVVFLVGHLHLVAYLLNAFRVQIEDPS